MSSLSKIALAGIMILPMVSGCGGSPSPAATPTLSKEDVLATAQAIAEATRLAASPTPPPPTPTPTVTPILETATPTVTATPASATVTATYNANVRMGPGEEYPVIDFLLAGQQGEVLGRYDNSPIGTWYYIKRVGVGLNGWVYSGAVTVGGDASKIPVLEAPPTPTPGPSPTPPA
jgi:uncharacterized protein YgiM (DUF1202 family)